MGKTKSNAAAAKKVHTPAPPAPATASASKRQRSIDDAAAASSKKVAPHAGTGGGGGGKGGDGKGAEEGDLVFEDPFGDEFDPEDIEAMNEHEGSGDDEEEGEGDGMDGDAAGSAMDVPDGGEAAQQATRVWRAGVDELEEGDELEYDSTAYHMYHSLRPEWPCLSFDVIRDSLGTNRSRFPHTVFAVAGTQADRADKNRLQDPQHAVVDGSRLCQTFVGGHTVLHKAHGKTDPESVDFFKVMKLSDLHRTGRKKDRNDGSDDEDDESADEEGPDETEDDPTLDHINIPHRGGINRVRSMPQRPGIVATWSETSDVHVWDLEGQVSALAAKGATRKSKVDPAFTFHGHTEEGFAMDWSPTEEGLLATGDCGNCVYVTRAERGGWVTDPVPFVGHVASVEDIQWSPTETTVFASGSADMTVKVWDLRKKNGAMLSLKAHGEDVNVISWNRNVTYLLASGSDDGSFKIWDLRAFGSGEPVAQFRWHKGPITSIEWHPTDESMLAASGADNQLTLWDLSVEADDEAAAGMTGASAGELKDLPPQLLFIHQGQTDIKELHFHPQIPGVIMSTAADGFNVFKPATTV